MLARELAHIRNHDILVSSVAATIAGAISAIASVLQLSFLFGADEDGRARLGLPKSLVVAILAPIAATLLQLGVSRQREYLADATAAGLLGSGEPLADAPRGDRAEPRAGAGHRPGDRADVHRQPAQPRERGDAVLDPSPHP